MRRRDPLRAGAAADPAGLTGRASGGDAPAFAGGFGDGLGDREAGAAIGPEVDVDDFECELDVSEAGATHCVDELSVRVRSR